MGLQSLDLALGHQRVQLQRQAGRSHHLVHRHGQRDGQAHAAVVRVGGHAQPTAFGNRGEAFGKTGRRADDAVFQMRGMQVAGAVQGGQNLFAHTARFGQDRVDGFGRRLGKPVGGGDAVETDDLVEDELQLGDRGAIGHSETSHSGKKGSIGH